MDSSRIEIIIQKILTDHDATYVADDLLKKWDLGELTEKEQDIAAQFLIQSGFLVTLQSHFAKQLTQDKYIAWIPFLELLARGNKTLPDEVVEPILVGMTEGNKLEDIMYVQKAQGLHPRFKKLIQTFQNESFQNFQKEKAFLKEKLQRHITERMDEEVHKLSVVLRQRFPEDKEIQELTSDVDMARIRNLIYKKERDIQQILPNNFDTVSEEDKKKVIHDVVKKAKDNPKSAYDLSILLAQMEIYDEALKCLEYAPPSIEKDWLKLDLLIKCESYIDAISESFEIEKKYPDKPETIISTLEYRAQCLYGLGEKEKAIQILEKILETTPKNYTAKVLLHTWRRS